MASTGPTRQDRKNSKGKKSNSVFDSDFAQARAAEIGRAMVAALRSEKDKAGGYAQLAAATADLLERRRLRSLIELEDPAKAWVSCVELGALDVLWRQKGGFLTTLGRRTIAHTLSQSGPVYALVPVRRERVWENEPASERASDLYDLGYVTEADVVSADHIREALSGLNSNLFFQVKLTRAGQDATSVATDTDFDKVVEGTIGEKLPSHRTLILIGSPRSNPALCPALLDSMFGAAKPFRLPRRSDKRCVVVDNGREIQHCGVVCFRRADDGRRTDLLVGGDSALATIAAARELRWLSDPLSEDGLAWYLVKAKVDKDQKRLVGHAVIPGYGNAPPVQTTDERTDNRSSGRSSDQNRGRAKSTKPARK